MAKPETTVDIVAFAIWSAMNYGVGHSAQNNGRSRLAVEMQNASNATQCSVLAGDDGDAGVFNHLALDRQVGLGALGT